MRSPGPLSSARFRRASTFISNAHRISLFLFAVLPLLLVSCDDEETAGGGETGRFVYYCIGAPATTVELRRQDLDDQQDALVSAERVVSISTVAINGRVLYETLSGVDWPYPRRLFGRCEGGQIIPVPMPVSPDPAVEYLYVAHDQLPRSGLMTISHAGHHAAFFTYERAVGSTDTTAWKFHLCVFDCGSWTMDMADVGARIQEYFAGTQPDFDPNEFIPSAVWLSNDGSVAAMQVEARQVEQHLVTAARTLLLGGTLHQLSVLAEHARMDWNVTAFDGATAQLYALSVNAAVRHDCRGGGAASVALSLPGASGFATASGGTGEIAWYDSSTPEISILRLSNGQMRRIPLDRSRLASQFPDAAWLVGESGWCGMSPDGEWIALVAQHAQDDGLYVMRRDGSDTRRIARGAFVTPPVVSDVVPL
ncbi:MAG: hypothetical protein RBU27_07920 [Bacteroidota bacterium]|nr:hypothetical protein [Bacteroidota bacterium]